jgi:hypothetical protein
MKAIIPNLLANAVVPNRSNWADISTATAYGGEHIDRGTLTPAASVA